MTKISMNNLYVYCATFLCFSYFFTSVFLLSVGVDTRSANFIIKLAVSVLFLASLFYNFSKNNLVKIIPKAAIIFFVIYGIRILYDVMVDNIIIEMQNNIYVLGFYFVLTMLPVLIIIRSYRDFDVPLMHKLSFLFILISNIALFYYSLTSDGASLDSAFSGRSQADGTIEGTAIINPIGVSMMGGMLTIFTLGRLAFFTSEKWWTNILYLGAIGVGLFNLLSGGSRGPALAFFASLLGLIFAMMKTRRKVAVRVWGYLGAMIAVLFFLISTKIVPIFLVDRFIMMFDDRSQGIAEERDYVFYDAFQSFINSPFWGESYAIMINGYYGFPHNVVLEALMATGVIGGLFFFIMIARTGGALLRILSGNCGPYAISIGLISICQFVVALTSSSISQSPELWILVTLVLMIGSQAAPHIRDAKPRQYRRAYSHRPVSVAGTRPLNEAPY